MKLFCIAAATLALFISSSAFAWNDRGHMIVAAIAWDQLTPQAQQRVSALLQRDPQYASWVAGVADEDKDEVAFVRAATWADFIKRSDAGYEDDGNDASAPAAKQNSGYDDRHQHRYWHYTDLPFSTDGTRLIQPQAPNVETQIALFRDTIASDAASDDLRSYDLVWLLHLVGDIHQPLHTTSRFSHDFPNGDQGGNLVTLCNRPCRRELHAFWDDVLGTSESAMSAIKRAQQLEDAPLSAVAITDPHIWAQEGLSISKSSVYASPIGDGAGPFTLDDGYKATAKSIAEERAAIAGARLAKLINSSLR